MSKVAGRHPLHWLPNALTVGRCLLVPVVVWAIVTNKGGNDIAPYTYYMLALSAFLLCAITDFFDGYFARRFNVTSDFGRMLDPIADKILVAGTLIALCIISKNPILITFSLIIIFRDFAVSGVREFAANSNRILAPTKLAKWKTAVEMLAIILFLVSAILDRLTLEFAPGEGFGPEIGMNVFLTGQITLGVAAALSAYTGFHYFREALKKS